MVAPTIIAPVIADAPQRHVLYQHLVVSERNISATMQSSIPALYRHMREAGIIPAGPPFAVYNTDAQPWDIDICAPISAPVTPSSEFRYMELPATRVVSLEVTGPYERLSHAYDQVVSYIRSNNLEMTGAPREIYLSPPSAPASEVRTIIEWPIA